jgi:ABC-type transporter Mla maintaining outer membrane lipid asymmetry ATPase subunit MlaF
MIFVIRKKKKHKKKQILIFGKNKLKLSMIQQNRLFTNECILFQHSSGRYELSYFFYLIVLLKSKIGVAI